MKAISSMATRHVLAELAGAAVDAGLPALEIESVGGVDAARRVRAGEQFDLVFLADDALEVLAGDGSVDPATLAPLVVSQVAVAVPAGSDETAARPGGPAFPDGSGVRTAIAAARRIGYSTGPSGTALLALIEHWGLADEVAERLLQARPGIPVARLLADGEVDLGFQQVSELVGQPGVRILGVLPSDCAIVTVFAGAVAARAAEPGDARRLLDYFSSAAVAPIIARHGFGEPGSAV